MFSFIKGKITNVFENLVILENNGIGYEIWTSTNTITDLSLEEDVKLYVFMQVKEDGITLYGFGSIEEKDMFLNLISVSGVGGKTAIQILSGAKLKDLISSIANNDTRFLKTVKGIGKKTAELICVSLSEKMTKMGIGMIYDEQPTIQQNNQYIIDECCEGLVSLGLKRVDALKLIKKNYTGVEDVETLITKVLRNMN